MNEPFKGLFTQGMVCHETYKDQNNNWVSPEEIVNINEPFNGLFTQGMVCHETYKDNDNNWLSPDEVFSNGKNFYKKSDKNELVKVGSSESMSKSKKNTIDPEEIIKNYGADSVRLFIMSDSPPEKDVQWSDDGMESAYKFLQKLWTLHNTIINKIELNEKQNANDEEISKFVNILISKITHNIENFRYNVIIANFYEMYNFLSKELKKPISRKILVQNYSKILILLSPFIPHLASECLEQLNKYENVGGEHWPEIQKKYLEQSDVMIVVQINGKKREVLKIEKDSPVEKVLEIANNNDKIKNYIKDKEIIKKIFVPNKVINLIIK